jgi:hypothetical protein
MTGRDRQGHRRSAEPLPAVILTDCALAEAAVSDDGGIFFRRIFVICDGFSLRASHMRPVHEFKMSNPAKFSAVGDCEATSGPAPSLDEHTRTSPTTDSSRSQSPMVATSSVAAALAVLPTQTDAPRVIQQFTSVFLVSRLGELWRVYDVDDPQASERFMPTCFTNRSHRIFVSLARNAQLRVHAFAPGMPRDLDPLTLQEQLDQSVLQ